ncbi:MAG: aminotransferase [Pseudomonadota bacterium]
MSVFNANLIAAAASPIMEAGSWVRDAVFPANRPLLDLSQAAPATPPPLPIREAMADAALHRTDAHFYGPVLGNDDLRAEIATQWSAAYDGQIAPDQVAITAGCNQAFCAAISSVAGPGEAVMLPWPWYFNHKMWLDMAGIGCVPLPVGADLMPDPDAVRAALTPEVRALALVSPNNPTGAEYPPELLAALLDVCADAGVLMVLDETYRDFHSIPGAPHDLFAHPGWQKHFAHLYSFSKTFRLMGHRVGALVTSAERLTQIEKFLDTMTICPGQMGQIAALHGLRHLGDWVAAEREVFAGRRALLRDLIAQDLPDWTLHGAGAYFAWISPPGGRPSMETARALVREQSLLVLPGEMFVPTSEPTSALRIAFANADEKGIRETVARLASYTSSL